MKQNNEILFPSLAIKTTPVDGYFNFDNSILSTLEIYSPT